MIAAALRKLLTDDTDLAAIVGERVIYGRVDAEPEPDHVIRFLLVDGAHESTISGEPVDLQFPVWEFSCRSPNPFHVDAMARRIVAVFEANSTGATVTVEASDIVIDTLEILDSGTDEPSVVVSREGVSSEIFIRSVLVEVGHR